MSTCYRFVFAVACLLAAVFVGAVPQVAAETYVEDFTTTTYRDAANTTADWNTAAGELRLFPFAPSIVGTLDTPDAARALDVDGDLLYLADTTSGLHVIDISDPSAPLLLGTYDSPHNAVGVMVEGDIAYLADGDSGLRVIDVSDPTNPVEVGFYEPWGGVHGISVQGNHAYLACGGDGLRIVDISTPSSPTLVATLPLDVSAQGLDVEGDVAYVADTYDPAGLKIIDVSDPANPVLLSTYITPGWARRVQVVGRHAFVSDITGGLLILDVSDPTSPVHVATFATPGGAFDAWVDGDRAYVAVSSAGLLVLDISDPANPVQLHLLDTGGVAESVIVEGSHAYMASRLAGLAVVEIMTHLEPRQVFEFPPVQYLRGCEIVGDYAYFAGGSPSLRIYDVSDITAPLEVGRTSGSSASVMVEVHGDHAYVDGQGSGDEFQIIDVSEPTAPVVVESNSVYRGRFTVAGNLAYIAGLSTGFHVLDVSDPTDIDWVATNASFDNQDVAVAGDRAYVAGTNPGFLAVDISDPTDPTWIGVLPTADCRRVEVQGDHAYIGQTDPVGLGVIDISDPTTPTAVGFVATGGLINDIRLVGNRAYVMDQVDGFQVVDIRNPTAPAILATTSAGGSYGGIGVNGEYAIYQRSGAGGDVFKIGSTESYEDHNEARSTAMPLASLPLVRYRLGTDFTGDFTWMVTGDGGAAWDTVTSDSWYSLDPLDSDLRWRAVLAYDGIAAPICDRLELNWLAEPAAVAAIEDVAGDQGRQVRVTWSRSGYDFVGDPQQIVEYSIYRRIEGWKSGQSIVPDDKSAALAGWDFVTTAPADAEDEYSVVVPTLADSTEAAGVQWSVFMVRARVGPGVFYDSPPDSGYSLDNLVPAAPSGILAQYGSGSVALQWDANEEEDLQYYQVYRGTDPGFVPDPGNLVHTTADLAWTDPTGGYDHHYKLTATDFAGNESVGAAPENVSGTPLQEMPLRTALYQNVPNPFNPVTVIMYDLPRPAVVRLRIFDVAGRIVRTLVAGGVRPEGRHEAPWNGRDNNGRQVAAGVYFYRLDAGGVSSTKRMMLVK